jgi:hypothetical protein
MKKIAVGLVAAMALSLVTLSIAQAAPPGPPMSGVRICQAFSSQTHYITYVAGQRAEFAIHGDGDTDLDIFVYDAQGNLVTSCTGTSDIELAVWYPTATQQYRIVVVNLGSVWNRYGWATN